MSTVTFPTRGSETFDYETPVRLRYVTPAELIHEMVSTQPEDNRILVQVYMPHLKDYGRSTSPDLVYGCGPDPLSVGDLVTCPGTQLRPAPFTGVVISLDASEHPYRGPVKSIIGKIGNINEA